MTPTKYARLVELENLAEARLRRAFRRWEKARSAARRAEKTLDKDFSRRSEIGGECDFRDMLPDDLKGDGAGTGP